MNRLLILLLVITSTIRVTSQDGPPPPLSPERLQEIKAQKSAYLTARLNLSPEEAQRFWPVYNKYDDETDALRRELRGMDRAMRDKEGGMTEAEAAGFLDKEIANRRREIDLMQQFQAESRRLIGAVRTVELGRAERDFHREVLKRYRGGPDGDGPPSGKPRGSRP